MISFPNAKINIGLNIINRRDEGYHNLETIFYPVQLKDALEIVEAKELSFTSSGLKIPGKIEDNLCVKAFRLLKADYDIPFIHIHLHKHIPIGAGLGGGSSDAAFLIKLINSKFELGLTDDKMESYSQKLGADCSFFIRNKPVFASGKGDEFKDIEFDLSAYYLVLIVPPVQIATSEAFKNVNPAIPTHSLLELINRPKIEWKDTIENDFEKSIFHNYPKIEEIKKELYRVGALFTSMSGSGSSVYGIFNNPLKLKELERENQIFYGV